MVNEKNQKIELAQETKGKNTHVAQQVEEIGRDQLVKAIGLDFDFEHPDRFWEKYGIINFNLLLNERGTNKKYDDKKWKAITQYDKMRQLVGRKYVVYPNEEVIVNVNDLLEADSSLEILGEPKFTNHGLNMFITIVSNKHVMKVENSHVENDEVKLGVIIRNSLGGGMGLGTDIFTFRSICQNGAVFGYNEIGSDFMRHFGKDPAKVTEKMRQLITNSLGRFEDIHQYYDKMAEKKIGEGGRQKVLKQLEWVIAQKHYPDYVDIETVKINKDQAPDHVYSLSSDAKKYSMWRVFNDITQNIWHEKELRLESKRDQTIKLHKIIIESLRDSKVN